MTLQPRTLTHLTAQLRVITRVLVLNISSIGLRNMSEAWNITCPDWRTTRDHFRTELAQYDQEMFIIPDSKT